MDRRIKKNSMSIPAADRMALDVCVLCYRSFNSVSQGQRTPQITAQERKRNGPDDAGQKNKQIPLDLDWSRNLGRWAGKESGSHFWGALVHDNNKKAQQ